MISRENWKFSNMVKAYFNQWNSDAKKHDKKHRKLRYIVLSISKKVLFYIVPTRFYFFTKPKTSVFFGWTQDRSGANPRHSSTMQMTWTCLLYTSLKLRSAEIFHVIRHKLNDMCTNPIYVFITTRKNYRVTTLR